MREIGIVVLLQAVAFILDNFLQGVLQTASWSNFIWWGAGFMTCVWIYNLW